jgi:hypothetical protein
MKKSYKELLDYINKNGRCHGKCSLCNVCDEIWEIPEIRKSKGSTQDITTSDIKNYLIDKITNEVTHGKDN